MVLDPVSLVVGVEIDLFIDLKVWSSNCWLKEGKERELGCSAHSPSCSYPFVLLPVYY